MKAFTDIEQSKKLAEILPIESADMHYVKKTHDFRGNPIDGEWSEPKYGNPNSKYANYIIQNFASYEKIPCWSLAALLDVLPYPIMEQDYNGKWVCRITHNNTIYLWEDYNPVDSCVKMILKLKEKNLI